MYVRSTIRLLLSALFLASACGGSGGLEPVQESESGAPPLFPSISSPGERATSTPPSLTFAHEWVVSPTGYDSAAGTAAAPVRTLAKALSLAGPGDLIRVRSGTYAERLLISGSTRPGTSTAPITLQGEGQPRIIPGPEAGALVVVEQPHWTIRGLDIDVRDQAAFGVAFSGNTEGSLLGDSEIHHAHYGAGISFHGGAHGATLENNHIHDILLQGKDAHGVLIQPTARDITVRGNVIHGNSGDSIQCYSPDGSLPGSPAQGLLIEDNDLYGNTEQSVDIKTCYDVTLRRNKMHHARRDPRRGGNGTMVVHMSARNVLIEDNEFYDAGLAIGIGGNRFGPPPSGIVIRDNLIRDMITEGGMTGGGLQLAVSEGTQVTNNTFTRLQGPALIIGGGEGGPTRGLVVTDNRIDTPQAVNLGSQASGLAMDNNLYLSGTLFHTPSTTETLTQWQARGQDEDSSEVESVLGAPRG